MRFTHKSHLSNKRYRRCWPLPYPLWLQARGLPYRLRCVLMLLVVLTTLQLLFHLNWVVGLNATGPAASYQLTYKGHTNSNYTVAEGYWHYHINHSFPHPSALKRARFRAGNDSCWQLAAGHVEPYTPFYHATGQAPQPLPGGVPRAAFRWHGRISRRLFESVPFLLRHPDTCPHCTFVLRYKVLQGQLYVDKRRRRRALDGQEGEADMLEELMLAALHLYKVPDADLLVHLGDGCPPGLPLLQANINRSLPQAGFAIPKYMWRDALGPQQLQVLAECLEARYPRQQRLGKAVWRGSTTDTHHPTVEEASALDLTRVRLALMGRWYPALMDAALVAYVQQAFDGQCVHTMLPLGSRLPLEEFNRYAMVLDVDGNGWSDRYRLLAHMNTPVLKQASNLTGYFEHLVAPGLVVEQFAADLSDLPVRVAQLLREAGTPAGQQRLQQLAQQQQGLAHYHLNHVAVAAAMASAMTQASQLSDWKVVQEPGYEPVPWTKCCTLARSLPAEFVTAVRGRQAPLRTAPRQAAAA